MSTTEPSDNADLEIEVIPLDSGINVALEGELDIATAPVLHEELSELVTLGCIDLTLDLAELRFIDWPGLSVLTMTRKPRRANGWLTGCGSSDPGSAEALQCHRT